MNIGEELQGAVQRSAKLGTFISGLFESDRSADIEAEIAADSAVQNKAVSGQQTGMVANAAIADSAGTDIAADTAGIEPADTNATSIYNAGDESTAVEQAESTDSTQSNRVEAALVEAAKEDPAAFGALYERYVDRVYAYIYHRVSNTQEAEDLTARTFYRALSRLHTYEDRGYPFSAWLFRIAHNLVANWHRDRSRRRILSLDRIWSHSSDNDTPEQAVEEAERSNALWDAINRLPNDRRELILYKFGSRLSNVEIGEMMNKSESAIKSLYFRTLAALRSDLEKDAL